MRERKTKKVEIDNSSSGSAFAVCVGSVRLYIWPKGAKHGRSDSSSTNRPYENKEKLQM